MPTFDELVPIADESAFIFVGTIVRTGASPMPGHPASHSSVVVSVADVIKAPAGMRLDGQEVTVSLHQHLDPGRYVFFADPVAVGTGLAVKERAHLDGSERDAAAQALERAYVEKMARRLEAAALVALGTEGDFRPLFPPAERRGRVAWALARFELERVLKGKGRGHVTLVGPVPASKRLPRAPALRPGRRAILILQRPPEGALPHIPAEDRQAVFFIADVLDIQPPDRLETLERMVRGPEKEDRHA
jgi:hypothetical protein